jgi:AmiR/NasT family two-component response regulator
MNNQLKNTISIPANEYNYLKKIEKSFEQLFSSFAEMKEIEKARKEIKSKKYISQDEVFRKLGI